MELRLSWTNPSKWCMNSIYSHKEYVMLRCAKSWYMVHILLTESMILCLKDLCTCYTLWNKLRWRRQLFTQRTFWQCLCVVCYEYFSSKTPLSEIHISCCEQFASFLSRQYFQDLAAGVNWVQFSLSCKDQLYVWIAVTWWYAVPHSIDFRFTPMPVVFLTAKMTPWCFIALVSNPTS